MGMTAESQLCLVMLTKPRSHLSCGFCSVSGLFLALLAGSHPTHVRDSAGYQGQDSAGLWLGPSGVFPRSLGWVSPPLGAQCMLVGTVLGKQSSGTQEAHLSVPYEEEERN